MTTARCVRVLVPLFQIHTHAVFGAALNVAVLTTLLVWRLRIRGIFLQVAVGDLVQGALVRGVYMNLRYRRLGQVSSLCSVECFFPTMCAETPLRPALHSHIL